MWRILFRSGFGRAVLAGLGWAFIWLCVSPIQCAAADRLAISQVRIESSEVVVTVTVPPGVRKVTLESRTRLGAGTWVPRAVQRLVGLKAETVTFRLPKSAAIELLRVRGDENEPLPAEFYDGQKTFNGQVSQSANDAAALIYTDLGTRENVPTVGGGAETREVVESDIWKIKGNTLYFFNQYRGLQVIDISSPDAPRVTGTLSLPAAGDQMYLLDDQHVVLLARDCSVWGSSGESAALVVRIESGVPAVLARIPIEGSIAESRLVGSALYIASLMYKQVLVPPAPDPGGSGKVQQEQWEWGTEVSSVDLSNPAQPTVRDRLWFPGYGNVVSATDRYFFVVTQDQNNWWESLVQLIDIAAPDGAMKRLGMVRPGGRVPDKFKLNVAPHAEHGEVLSVICEAASTPEGRRASVLKTYSLGDPAAPKELGMIEVGHGESLFATRFDGARVYIVTYQRIDPLWVVDLSDPTKPVLSGELHVPGWSTYIHPLGNRLVTIGIDDQSGWKVAVSLFDVSDAQKPSLLSKVTLGESGSWSEANLDEKAFAVLPEAGLILVPYGEWASGGYATQVQLIDLGNDTLAKRGVIAHQMQPRRATAYGDRILSVSGKELMVVDAGDRDRPSVTATLVLSWTVERLLLANGWLIEAEAGAEWPGPAVPVLRVAAAAAPDVVLSQAALGEGQRLVGMTIRDGVLFVLQAASSSILFVPDASTDDSPEIKPNVTLTAFSLAGLPELKLLAKTKATVETATGFGNFKPLWPKPGVLVWASSGGMGPWLGEVLRVGRPVGGIIADWWWWPRWGYGGGLLLAFDTNNAESEGRMDFLSAVDLSNKGQYWNFSEAFEAAPLVYVSHRSSSFVPKKPGEKIPINNSGLIIAIGPEPGFWETKDYLDVVDFTDPKNPTARTPVEIPSQLRGIGANGAVLYTVGYHYDANGSTDWTEWLDALAYDGVNASLVASMKLPTEWPHPVLVSRDAVFIGRPGSNSTAGTLETWALGTDIGGAGKFDQKCIVKLETRAQEMAIYGQLLAVSSGDRISVWDADDIANLRQAGSEKLSGCIWVDLANGDASAEEGLWLPLREYGVFNVPTRVGP